LTRIALQGVWKRFDGVAALCDVDLEVASGRRLVIVGPSGAGKTTLLRILAGLEAPDAGRVGFDDDDVTAVPPERRDVAMVFQQANLYPHMTVYENLAFGLRVRKVRRSVIDAAVREAAALLGIGDLLGRMPGTLSAGQRGRVALGRAVVRRPRVFCLDEPLANLDGPQRRQMRLEIARLQRRLGVTTVYVTHDQAEAMALADRLCVLEGGRVRQVGGPSEVYRRPADRFVAGFFGTGPTNFVAGAVVRADGAAWFTADRPRMRWRLPTAVVDALPAGFTGPVVLGVRPEHVRLDAAGPGPDASWDVADAPGGNGGCANPSGSGDGGRDGSADGGLGRVTGVEWLGAAAQVTVAVDGGVEWTCLVDAAHAPDEGRAVAWRFDAAGVMWFAADGDGVRLYPDDGANDRANDGA